MKTKRALLVITGLALFFSVGTLVYLQMTEIPIKIILVYLLIGVLAIISVFYAFKKMKEEKEGQPKDDEFTNQIKYKSGYYAYVASMYMWLFLFLFRSYFPDIETIVGGGVLLSALIGFISKMMVKREINEE